MFHKPMTALAAVAVLAAAGCSDQGPTTDSLAGLTSEAPTQVRRGLFDPRTPLARITLTSSAFVDGEPMPARFTCDGRDVSPPLSWTGVPEGTKSLVLVVSDPDAPHGTFSHWVAFNLPADLTELPEGVSDAKVFGTIAGAANVRPVQATNGFNHVGYNGPCPPKGPAHRYVFQLYAIDTKLTLDTGADRGRVLDAIAGHVLGEGRLTATFAREPAAG